MNRGIIDLRSAEDPRDVVHLAVQAILDGKILALPTETTYVIGCSALSEDGVAKILAARSPELKEPLTLVLRSAEEAIDYSPNLSLLAQRLMRNCWPGPVTLAIEDQHPDSLTTQFSPIVQQGILHDGEISMWVPAHHTVMDIMQLIAGPLVICSSLRSSGQLPVTAQEIHSMAGDLSQMVLDNGRTRFAQPSTAVRIRGDQYDVVREGVISRQTLSRFASMTILLVCTGNTCRSPMAEVQLRNLISQKLGCKPDEVEDKGYNVSSAGLAASTGGPASSEAVTVMRENGLDLKGHQSQVVTEPLLNRADLVLTMTGAHAHVILSRWPEVAGRVRTLSRDGGDISDPIGGDTELYRQCAAQINTELKHWVDVLGIR